MSAAPDPVDLYVRALAAFGEQVAAVAGDEWSLSTPCPAWDVRMVVAHVVLGEAQVPDLAAGRPPTDAELDVAALGPEPLAAWRGTALRAIEVARATPLDAPVRHPSGDVAFERVLGFRVTENVVHAWDLAAARAQSHAVDDEIAAWALDFWLPMADQLSGSEHFAAMREPAGTAPGARLLALLGR